MPRICIRVRLCLTFQSTGTRNQSMRHRHSLYRVPLFLRYAPTLRFSATAPANSSRKRNGLFLCQFNRFCSDSPLIRTNSARLSSPAFLHCSLGVMQTIQDCFSLNSVCFCPFSPLLHLTTRPNLSFHEELHPLCNPELSMSCMLLMGINHLHCNSCRNENRYSRTQHLLHLSLFLCSF